MRTVGGEAPASEGRLVPTERFAGKAGGMSLRLILASLPGLASLLLVPPEVPGVPRLVLLLNPLLLVVALAFAGSFAAPRAGLRLRAPCASARGALAVLGGSVLLGLTLGGLDHATRGAWQAAPAQPPSVVEGWSPAMLVLGLLYGGVAEEVMFRWGVMSLVALGSWRLLARRAAVPPRGVMLGAVVVSAAVFAASHLPALLIAGAEPAPALLLRTLGLNLVAGLVFGWLFWRRDLLSAMAAHAGTHLGFAALAVAA